MSKRRRKGIVKSTQQPQEDQMLVEEDASGPLIDTFTKDRRTMGSSAGGPPRTARVDDLVGNPDNPREDLGEVEELAASLKAHGVRQPLSVLATEDFLAVHPHHESALGKASWVVINGNRRLAAAVLAGLDLVPIHMSGGTGDAVSMRAAVLVENIHRKSLAPLEEAREIDKLVGLGLSRSEVARLLEKTPGWVTQRLILLELHPDLQEALSTGDLKLGQARELGKLPQEQQVAAHQGAPEGDAAFYTVKGSSTEPGTQPEPSSAPPSGEGAGAGAPSGEIADRSDTSQGEGSPDDDDTPAVQLTLSLEWSKKSDRRSSARKSAKRIYTGLGRLDSEDRDAILDELQELRAAPR